MVSSKRIGWHSRIGCQLLEKKVASQSITMFINRLYIVEKLAWNGLRNRETWDGLRTFPWREFGVFLEELLPFAA